MSAIAARPLDLQVFARELSEAETPERAYAVLVRAAAAAGFHQCDYAAGDLRTPRPQSALDVDFLCYLSNAGSAEGYLAEGFAELDPFGRAAVQRNTPVTYGEILQPAYDHPLLQDMLDHMAAREVREGLLFPIHSAGLRFAAVCMGTRLTGEAFAEADRRLRPALSLMAHEFHERLTPMLWPPRAPVALSERERECLEWAAKGKTAWETSVILGLSESVVKKHLSRATAKLGAATRTQAVAEALANGAIQA